MFINRKSNRLNDYDYSMPGGYFVTINVRDRLGDRNVFGEIIDGKMILNIWGEIIKQQWEWLFMQYSYLRIDEYVIMPDHVHGIIIITAVGNGRDRSLHERNDHSLCDKNESPVNEIRDHSPQEINHHSIHEIKIKPLSELVGAFKTTTSKLIHESGNLRFHWQKSYYDRIIRDDEELSHIREYIRQNPEKWTIAHDHP